MKTENLNAATIATSFIFLALSIFLLEMLRRQAQEIDTLKSGAINRGYTTYNPTNGVWQWKEKE